MYIYIKNEWNLILKCIFKSGGCCGVSENTNLSKWMYLLKKSNLEKFLGQYSERAWKLWKPCVLLRVRFVAKDGIEEVAGPEAAVWQSYPASSEAFWNLSRDFQSWQLENSGWEKLLKPSAVFCTLVWKALCVLDLCEVPSVCDCSPVCCLRWHSVTWKEELFHTAKGSTST